MVLRAVKAALILALLASALGGPGCSGPEAGPPSLSAPASEPPPPPASPVVRGEDRESPPPPAGPPTPRGAGEADARRDLESGVYRILDPGPAEWWSTRWASILRAEHGIVVERLGAERAEYAMGYDSVSRPAIQARFGHGALEHAAGDARRQERERYRADLEPRLRPLVEMLDAQVATVESLATASSPEDRRTARGMIDELERPSPAYEDSSFLEFVDRAVGEPASNLDPETSGDRLLPSAPEDFGLADLAEELAAIRVRLESAKRELD